MVFASHLFPAKNELGEGPRWHPAEGKLYWLDIELGEIHTLAWRNNVHEVRSIGTSVGCLAFRSGGGLVLATGDGFSSWSAETGITEIIDPRRGSSEGRFNDGAVDPDGRFWAGTMTPEGSSSCLYRLDPGGVAERMESGIAISNGIGWSPDGSVCYFTDSPRKVIYAYDFDPVQGNLLNRRVWVSTPDNQGVPDGLVVDQDGCIWSARWDGWKVNRYDPDGNLILEVGVPCQRPTSCTFGGDDLSTLIITTARVGLSNPELEEQPDSGDLFYFDTDTKGLGENFFSG
jgi:sugar lactone lactonase YvrE